MTVGPFDVSSEAMENLGGQATTNLLQLDESEVA